MTPATLTPTTPTVLWGEEMPAEVRHAAAAPLAVAIRYAPRWCHELSMRWKENVTDSYAAMSTQPEYRLAVLTLHPSWLGLTSPERAEVLVHEVVHIAVQPLVNVVSDLLDAMADTPAPLQRWVREQCRQAMEGVTCDVTRALLTAADRAPEPAGVG